MKHDDVIRMFSGPYALAKVLAALYLIALTTAGFKYGLPESGLIVVFMMPLVYMFGAAFIAHRFETPIQLWFYRRPWQYCILAFSTGFLLACAGSLLAEINTTAGIIIAMLPVLLSPSSWGPSILRGALPYADRVFGHRFYEQVLGADNDAEARRRIDRVLDMRRLPMLMGLVASICCGILVSVRFLKM